ncbi:Mu transposase C-terminal domain-containing protein [Mycobacterium gordonae]|nr:Mu transposase C-terminal domain-containing protein [Mycobacterium gordonae]
MTVLLSIEQAAPLENISMQALNKRIAKGDLAAIKVKHFGRTGYKYHISLSDLSQKAQARYAREKLIPGKSASAPVLSEKISEKSLEQLSDKQRGQVAHWKKVLDNWRGYIAEYPKRKTEMTAEFLSEYNRWHPDQQLTERTLRHKWQLFRNYGEIALADGRADRADKGQHSIPDIAWGVFMQWWLDEAQPTVLHCYNLLVSWAKLDMPQLLPLPSVDAFYRETKKIPKAVTELFRYGRKAFEDEASPYLQRLYHLMDSNDMWVSDFHTLDLFVRDDVTGKVFRPHVVVWQDIRSRKMLSSHFSETSNSDAVIAAFRKAVSKWGIPNAIYLDNGREYLVSDFGGRGKRKTAAKPGYGATILERLQVEMINAKPGNARAKIAERSFRVLKEQFSRLFITFTGGRPEWKPERLEGEMNHGKNIPLLSVVKEQFETWLEGWYNKRASEAEGLNGKHPDACYEENLLVKKTATQEQLDLMLLRSAKTQLVDRNGVFLKFGDAKVWYYDPQLIFEYLRRPVFVRYNPDDLSTVRVDDESGKFILVAERVATGGYAGENDAEAIKRVSKAQKEQLSRTTGYLSKIAANVDAPDPMDIMQRTARANIEADQRSYAAPVLQPVRYEEQPAQQMAAGAEEDNLIDLARMIENAKRRKGEST